MIDFNNGIVKVTNDFIIHPNYTFDVFKKSKFYKNQEEVRMIYLEGVHNIDNNNYIVSLFFRNKKIYMLSLICCDNQYSEENEKKRKELHDEILKQFNIIEKKQFSWGMISSNYDSRSNCSSIDFCYY